MDRRKNPYTPNAGARPPALVGRDDELDTFDFLLDRLRLGYTEQSMLITGLRGVGKTVLLGEFRRRAMSRDWITVSAEITRAGDFRANLAKLAHEVLGQLAPRERWRDRAKRAAGILSSFEVKLATDGSLTAGFEVEAVPGKADSGNLEWDLIDLFVALGEAAKQHKRGIVFLLDEAQFLELAELEALIAAIHRTVQDQLPLTLVGAGLPHLPRFAAEAKSYAERLFTFPTLGQLSPDQAAQALLEPAHQLEVGYDTPAVSAVVEYTEGYPYFIQEYGKILWDIAASSPISLRDVSASKEAVEAKLDANFFRVRTERTTDIELQYLQAMAEFGGTPQKASTVAKALSKSSAQLGATRARLIEKGLLYSPAHGLAAFTVPQFDRYIRRTYPRTTDAT